jgi:radical SAM protein with 4Fe4S-binding SPASM domain
MDEVDRIISWIRGRKVGPYELEIRITNRCNLRCITCWDWLRNENTEEIDEKYFLKALDDAFKLNVKLVHICGGGEPLMRKNLVLSLIKKSKSYGMCGRLITNGTLFTKKDVIEIVKSGWDEILFSVDSFRKKDYEFIRGVDGSFNKVLNSLRMFKEVKKKLRTNKPKIILAPLLTNKVYDKLNGMVKFAKKVGAEEVCLQLMMNKTSGCEKLQLKETELMKLTSYIFFALKLAKKLKIKCNFEHFLDKKLIEKTSEKDILYKEDAKKVEIKKKDLKEMPNLKILNSPCFFPWYYIGIFVDGTVQPCADAPGGEEFENITKKKLDKIWFGKKFNEVRKSLINANLFDWCKKCCGNKIIETRRKRMEIINRLCGYLNYNFT